MLFRIEREEHVNKTFRLPKKMVNEMEKICEQKNISLNKLVMLCIQYAFDNMESDLIDKQ